MKKKVKLLSVKRFCVSIYDLFQTMLLFTVCEKLSLPLLLTQKLRMVNGSQVLQINVHDYLIIKCVHLCKSRSFWEFARVEHSDREERHQQ